MPEKELLELCRDIPYSRVFSYESAECYGIGKHLREYGFYPQYFPLAVGTDHGPSQRDVPTYLELNDTVPFMLYHSKRLVGEWRRLSQKPCEVMLSPFVFYRRKKNIKKSDTAKGTLLFPCHSGSMVDVKYDINEYIKSALALPEEFHPISACIFFRDVVKGTHKIFMKYGIPVFTAGHIYDERFTERFYDIIRNFAYTSSNHAGSYSFYSIEMGIPFFLLGKEPIQINRGDPNCPDGEYTGFDISKQYKVCFDIFSGMEREIPEEQKKLVESELGIHDGISRAKMAFILYSSLFKWVISFKWIPRLLNSIPVYDILVSIYNCLPSKLRHFVYFSTQKLTKEAGVFTHLTNDEKIALNRIAKRLKYRSCAVEIGSYIGASSCFIANGIKEKNGILYCIDTWENQDMTEGERNTYDDFVKNTKKYKDNIVPIKGWSGKVLAQLKEQTSKIDLLFIDGDHSYDACRVDWEYYSPMLQENAIVIFHDTGWADGVTRVIKEFVIDSADKILELPNMQIFKIK